MRYSPAHAAKSGSVPFMLRGPKSLRTVMSAAVAGVVGLVPTVLIASPAMALGTITVAATTGTTAEGGNLVFTVQNTGGTTASVALALTGTATAGTDYTAPTTPISIAAGATTTLTVPTTADNRYEGSAGASETVILTATVDASNNGTATGTITDADTAPTYTLTASGPVTEAVGAKSTITATLSKLSGVATVVTLDTVNGTAEFGTAPAGDYTKVTSQTFTIAAGQTSATYDIAVTPDGLKDKLDTETFTVNAAATNVATSAASVDVSIKDADAVPKVSIGGGGSGVEGGAGIAFPITLDHGSELPVTVQWDAGAPTVQQSGHNLATPGDDFPYGTTSQRTITIPATQTSTSVTPALTIVPTNDGLNELPEDFSVTISNATNATLGTTTKVDATITDANTTLQPTVSITPVDTVTEGNTGTSTKTFKATLSAKSGRTVKADWNTAPDTVTTGTGHATAGKDYVADDGTLTFAAGTLEQTFTIDVKGDTIDEGATPRAAGDGETFRVMFTAPAGDTSLGTSTPGSVKIVDDDLAPTIAFDDITMDEGDGAQALLTPLKLTGSSDTALTFDITDVTGATAPLVPANPDVTALPGGDDYDPITTTITVQPETSVGYGVVLVNGDETYEGDETAYFKATADAASAAYVTDPDTKTMKLTLENDDKTPNLEINSVTGNEGDTVAVMGTVTGSSQNGAMVSVSFAGGSSKGSKAAGTDDFVNPGLKLVDIGPDVISGTVIKVADLKLNTDTTAEPAETIIVTGTGVANSGTVTEGIVTIAANGSTPSEPGAPTLKASASERLGAGSISLTGKGTAGETVQLWGRTVDSDESDYAKISTATVTGSGTYAFSTKLSTDGMYFKVSNDLGDSNEVRVFVREDPDLVASSTSKGVVRLTVTGDPKIHGLSARVFRANSGGGWTMVGSGILNSSGTFTKTLTGQKSGKSYTFKAWVQGDGDRGVLTNYSSYSKSVKVK